MATKSDALELRIEKVERELAELKAALRERSSRPWYQEIIGNYVDHPDMSEVLRLGRRIRRGTLKG